MGLNTVAIHSDKTQWERNRILKLGRAGRLGHRGTAFTLVNNINKCLFLKVVNWVKPTGSQLPPPPPPPSSSTRLTSTSSRGRRSRKPRKVERMMSLVTKTNLLDIIWKHNRRLKR
ncbi:probable ATP-dependent RNA helicase DDX59 [Salvelinus alpinus]|uniref:probable ATP-dependent RNA helicase DDX59 n=1 Tax=Salvelinus alpinus TaxID=8036 RepID=UPI0039FD4F6F